MRLRRIWLKSGVDPATYRHLDAGFMAFHGWRSYELDLRALRPGHRSCWRRMI